MVQVNASAIVRKLRVKRCCGIAGSQETVAAASVWEERGLE